MECREAVDHRKSVLFSEGFATAAFPGRRVDPPPHFANEADEGGRLAIFTTARHLSFFFARHWLAEGLGIRCLVVGRTDALAYEYCVARAKSGPTPFSAAAVCFDRSRRISLAYRPFAFSTAAVGGGPRRVSRGGRKKK